MCRISYPFFLVIFVVVIFSCQREKKPYVFENSTIRFEFDPVNYGISGIIDQRDQFNFIRTVNSSCQLWELIFVKGDEREKLSNADFKLKGKEIAKIENGNKELILNWENISNRSEDLFANVIVKINLPSSSGLAEWTIAVENNSPEWSLEEVDFPKITGFLSKGSFNIAGCLEEINPWGTLYEYFEGRIEKVYPGGEGKFPVQFFSVMQGANSLYLAAHDSVQRSKTIVLDPGNEFCVKNLADSIGVMGNDYNASSTAVIGVYKGDWLEAAKIYRKFATQAPWIKKNKENIAKEILKDAAIYLCESENTDLDTDKQFLKMREKANKYFEVPLMFGQCSKLICSDEQEVTQNILDKRILDENSLQKTESQEEIPVENNQQSSKKGKSIPLFQAVYSGYVIAPPKNNQALTLQTDQFQKEIGRDFLYGCIPGGVGFEVLNKNEHQKKKRWLRKMGKARQAGNDFFVNGELVDLIDNGRFSSQDKFPEVMGSVWKMNDGTLNLVVMNFTPKQKEFAIRLNPLRYGLEPGKFDINLLYADEDGISTLDDIVGSEVLYPFEIRIYKAAQF